MADPTKIAGARGARAGKPTILSQLSRLRSSGMLGLLLLLMITIFVLPIFVPEGPTWHVLTDVMLTLVLISGVIAIADHRKAAMLLAGLALLVLIVRWAEWLVPAKLLLTLRHASAMSALLVLAATVGINVFASARSIGDRVFGAIVLYLLLGMIWAIAYGVIFSLDPGAFSKLPAGNGSIDDWFYFSFVTLTTVGYGDITPVARSARALAILEGLIGQLYPAIIIARLISLPGK